MKGNKTTISYNNDGTVGNFKIGGYATGSYAQTCSDCGEEFLGDKLSFQCLDCVIKIAERQHWRLQSNDVKLINNNLELINKLATKAIESRDSIERIWDKLTQYSKRLSDLESKHKELVSHL